MRIKYVFLEKESVMSNSYKKSIMALAIVLMASIAKAEPLTCVQNGYMLFVPSDSCQDECPGECIPTEVITRSVGEASCEIHVIEVDGKTYRVARACFGSGIDALAEAVDELYPELPMKGPTPFDFLSNMVPTTTTTGSFICIQDGYGTVVKDENGSFGYGFTVPLETCQNGCSGECIPEKVITEDYEDASCEVHVVEFDGKTYRVEHSCSGSNIFIESMKERYPLLPIKYLNPSNLNLE